MSSIKLTRISVKDKPNKNDLVETWTADASLDMARQDNESNTHFQFMTDMEANEALPRDQDSSICRSGMIRVEGKVDEHRQLFIRRERTKQRMNAESTNDNMQNESNSSSTCIKYDTRSFVGTSMARRMIGGFLLSPLKRGSSFRQKLCFGSNTGKENDIFSNTDLLEDSQQKDRKKSKESSSDHSSTHTKMSSFSMITEDSEDTKSSSSNGDEHNIYPGNQCNANHTDEKSGMEKITSSRLSRLHEYEAVYRNKVYVHIEEEEEQQQDETRISEFPFQRKINEKAKLNDYDDDEESEDGWSDTETEYAKDDSWYIDIELPTLYCSNQKKESISTPIDDNITSSHLFDDNSTEFLQKHEKSCNLIEFNGNVLEVSETKDNARHRKQALLTKKKQMIRAESYRDIVFRADDDIADSDVSASVSTPLTPCIQTFKSRPKYYKSHSCYEINSLSSSWSTNQSEKLISSTIKSSTMKQEMFTDSLDDLNVSAHTSTTIFDDVTNHSFYSLINMTQQMIPSSNISTTDMNNCKSLDQNFISAEVESSTNNPQTELQMLFNTTSDHERENPQQLKQYNVEHDDDQSATMMIGGITYRAKDIEYAWNEVEYSENIQDESISQVHELSNDICLSYRGSRIEDTSSQAILRQYDRYVDVFKRYQNLSNSDFGIYHHVTTKYEPMIERLEI